MMTEFVQNYLFIVWSVCKPANASWLTTTVDLFHNQISAAFLDRTNQIED